MDMQSWRDILAAALALAVVVLRWRWRVGWYAQAAMPAQAMKSRIPDHDQHHQPADDAFLR